MVEKGVTEDEWTKFDTLNQNKLNPEDTNSLIEIIKTQENDCQANFKEHLLKITDVVERNKIPMMEFGKPLELNVLSEVLGIVFYRVKAYIQESYPNSKHYEDFLIQNIICTIKEHLLKEEETRATNFHLSLLLHASCAFIDTHSDKACWRGITIITENFSITEHSLKSVKEVPEIKKVIDRVNQEFTKIYGSKGFHEGLEELIQKYNLEKQINLEDALEYIRTKLPIKNVIWVENGSICGMAGINNTIYISLIYMSPKHIQVEQIIYVISTKLHEDAHQLLRYALQDFGVLSPRLVGLKEHFGYEMGYHFEKILFGAIIISFGRADSILASNWEKKGVLNQDEILRQEAFIQFINPYLSGICPLPIFRFYK